MCLPNISILQDDGLKTEHNMTPEADPQVSPMGRKSNDKPSKLELYDHKSSTVDTISTDPIQSELTSPWPDQWQLEGLDNDMTDYENPWPNPEGMNAWNDAPYTTPWELLREPHWITEPDYAIKPGSEENPLPLMLQHPDKDNESKLEGELSPRRSNEVSNPKETLSLRYDQCNKEILDQRNPENKSQGSTLDNEEGTTDMSHHPTHQR